MTFSQVQPGQRFRYFPTDPKMAEIVSGFVYQKLAKPMPIERVWHSATYNATQKLPNPLKGMKTNFSPYTKVEVVE